MKRLYFIMGLVGLIFTFQNCQKNVTEGDTSSSSSDVGAKSAPLISDQTLQSMTFFVNQEVVDKNERTASEKAVARKTTVRADLPIIERPMLPKELNLDLQTGEVRVVDDSNKYCITAAEKSELEQILKQASICQSKAEANQACSMVYTLPYAIMHFQNEDIALGEGRSSCDRTDLCDAYPDLVKGFFAGIAKNLSQRICQ